MAVHGRLSIVLAFVLTGLSTIVVALRFYSRHFLVGKLSASDWVMLLGLLATWFSVVVNWYVIQFFDYRGVDSRASFARVASGSLLSIWVYRVCYILNLCLIKTSILLFYKYIASTRKGFHYLVRTLLAIILLGSASMIIAAVFTCYPVEDAWSFEVFEQAFRGVPANQCYNPGPFWLANAGYNLVTDVLIWFLPIIFFLNLTTMTLRRRLELVGTFSIGIMAIVGSAARLRVIVIWLSDPAHQQEMAGDLLIWSQVEQNVGIIAGSIPFLRPIFRKALGRIRARSRNQHSPGPAIRLIGDGAPDHHIMPRALVIPSPTPTFEGSEEFKMPKTQLPPIEPVRTQYSWGSAVWDGSQVRQVLPT